MLKIATPPPAQTARVLDIRGRLLERQAARDRVNTCTAALIRIMRDNTVLEFEAAMRRAEIAIHDGAEVSDAIQHALGLSA